MLALAALAFVVTTHADPHSKADLVSSLTTARPGSTFDVALRLRMEDGWHVYWKNPGESGLAPSIAWKLPAGWKAGPIEWPAPERLEKDGIVNYAYAKEVSLLIPVTVPANAKVGSSVTLGGAIQWLCCREACIPGQANGSVVVKVEAKSVPSPAASRLAKVRADLPRKVAAYGLKARRDSSEIVLNVLGPKSGGYDATTATFFPADDSIEPSAPQPSTVSGLGTEIRLKISQYNSSPLTRLRGLLVAPSGKAWARGVEAMTVDIPISKE